ncbi:MAG TPA: FHA domain-containing protein [Gemmataceae bacterium]
MLRCPKCEYENEDRAITCTNCSHDLSSLSPLPAGWPEKPGGAEPAEFGVVHLSPDISFSSVPAVRSPAAPGEAPPAGPAPEGNGEPHAPKTGCRPGDTQCRKPPEQARATGTPPEPAEPPADEAQPPRYRLQVIRGQRLNVKYPVYEGQNFLGRTDEKPVDIDLEDQEQPDQIWTSRQHAVITCRNGEMTIEDLSSLNGTFVNRTRVHPGQVVPLRPQDVIQIGSVHMRVTEA